MTPFQKGFCAVLPIISGIIPFGAVMGSSFVSAELSLWQAMFMNTVVYAGAAQLATTDLMKLNAAILVVVVTGLIINMRFLLYSAALSPYLKDSPRLVKFFCAFTLTDQSYAAMSVNSHHFDSNQDAVNFYMGSAVCMLFAWHGSVLAGFIFGNFAPAWLSLDFAIPLSFIALLMPSLKTKRHQAIALFSSLLSLVFFSMPMKTGLMLTALASIALAWMMIKKSKR